MKKLLFIVLLMPFVALAQTNNDLSLIRPLPMPLVDGVAQFDTVIELPNTPKSTIYSNAKIWANKTFNSQKYALQSDDKEAGLIIYSFTNEYSDSYKWGLGSIVFAKLLWKGSVSIFIKDNKVKMSISNIGLNYGMVDTDTPITPVKDYDKILQSVAGNGILLGGKKHKENSYLLAVKMVNNSIADFQYLLHSFAEQVKQKANFDF